jgi:hypothetical protein
MQRGFFVYQILASVWCSRGLVFDQPTDLCSPLDGRVYQ